MIRKKVQRKCKIRGYTLKVEALDEMLSFVNRFQGAEDDALDLLLDQLDHDSRIHSLPPSQSIAYPLSILYFLLCCLFVCHSQIFHNRQGTRPPCGHPFARSGSGLQCLRRRRSRPQPRFLFLGYSRY